MSNSMNHRSISISSNPIIGNISNITIISIGIVSHMLGATIRKSNRVRSSYTTSSISRFRGIKARTRIVIVDSVGVCVWIRLIRVHSNSMNNRVSNTMNSSGTMETVRSISHGSYTSTKSFGLSGASEFSLERFRNRLVRNLTSWSCKERSMAYNTMTEEAWGSTYSCHSSETEKSLHVVQF